MLVLVGSPPASKARSQDVAKISGGGAPPAEASATNAASPNPPFGLLHFDAALTDSSKANPYTQAGGHPYQFATEFNFATYSSTASARRTNQLAHQQASRPFAIPKDIIADLPPGLIANPQAVPHCSLADYFAEECERNKDAVGTPASASSAAPRAAVSSSRPSQPPAQRRLPGRARHRRRRRPLHRDHRRPSQRLGDYGVTATNVAVRGRPQPRPRHPLGRSRRPSPRRHARQENAE